MAWGSSQGSSLRAAAVGYRAGNASMVLDIDSKAVQPTLRAAASTLRAARAAVIGGYLPQPKPWILVVSPLHSKLDYLLRLLGLETSSTPIITAHT